MAIPGDVTTDYFTYDPLGNPIERFRSDPSFQDDSNGTGSAVSDYTPWLMDMFAFNAWGDINTDLDIPSQAEEQVNDDIPHSQSEFYFQTVWSDDEVGFRGEYGYQTDPQTGLVLAGHRYYSPFTRRWMNRDPTGYQGGMNLYEYSGDDPVNEVDESGDGGFLSGVMNWICKQTTMKPGITAVGVNRGDEGISSGELEQGGASLVERAPAAASAELVTGETNAYAMGASMLPIPGAAAEEEAASMARVGAAGADTEASVNMVRSFRASNPAFPPLASVLDAMGKEVHPNYDCSEIADDLRQAAGGKGSIIHVTLPGYMEVLVPESKGNELYDFHDVYTDGRYIYDPRLSSSAVPKGDWMRLMRGLNPGAQFTNR